MIYVRRNPAGDYLIGDNGLGHISARLTTTEAEELIEKLARALEADKPAAGEG